MSSFAIAPIETRYRGYRFRSRLEARWAVFFDCMNVRWEYEKEGYQLPNGELYLPDFWLPDLHLWVEIKGQAPTEQELQRCYMLRDATDATAVIFQGPPNDYLGIVACYDVGDDEGILEWNGIFFSNDRGGNAVLGRFTWHSVFSDSVRLHDLPASYLGRKVEIAAAFAKGARFEHGEQPDPRDCWDEPLSTPGSNRKAYRAPVPRSTRWWECEPPVQVARADAEGFTFSDETEPAKTESESAITRWLNWKPKGDL